MDIIQPHNPTVAEVEDGGLVDAMREMRDSGKVRHLGISTTLPYLPTFLEWDVFDTMQIPYSALEREHEDWITKAAEAGVGIIIRGGVAQGEVSSGDRVGTWGQFERAGLDELREPGESRSAFVLRYTLTHPHAHAIIVGTTRIEHLRENVARRSCADRCRRRCTRRPSAGSTGSARRPCRRGTASNRYPSLYLSPTGGSALLGGISRRRRGAALKN